MKYILAILVFTYFPLFSQNYLNDDGTISDHAKREIIVAGFKDGNGPDIQYDREDDYFVIITKYDCGDKTYGAEEMQKKAMIHCFGQLLNTISSLQKSGFQMFSDAKFKGMIFKTNTICMYKTRRYHFKFSMQELERFPLYLDFEELVKYVIIENKNENIIYVKNEK